MIPWTRRVRTDEDVSGTVADFVGSLSRHAGLTRAQAYRLRLAADEITTNVCQHGYAGGRGVVDLVAGMDAGRAWVRIEDDAPAFDPRSHDPTPRLTAGPTEREVGGLGLFLALNNVDEYIYDRVGGRNRNTLVIRCHASDAGADNTKGGVHDRDTGVRRG
jgi:serine/threonine-protein kinase RsbW